MTTSIKGIVSKTEPRPAVEYVNLEDATGDGSFEGYYVTADGDGNATVWTWERDMYRSTVYPAEMDRQFRIEDLEEANRWLARASSKDSSDGKEVSGLGTFIWDGEDVMLMLPCGDNRIFSLAFLRLIVRALKAMEPWRPEYGKPYFIEGA